LVDRSSSKYLQALQIDMTREKKTNIIIAFKGILVITDVISSNVIRVKR
jgi:hypothetical protein